MGAIPESQIREFLEKVIGKGAGAERADALAAAAEARAAGDVQTAADIYSAVLEQAPDSADAAAGLADLLFEARRRRDGARRARPRCPRTSRTLRRSPPCAPRSSLPRRLPRSAIRPNSRPGSPRIPTIIRRASTLPSSRMRWARRAEAADNLLAIVKADRNWRDDAARQQLLQFFDAWGPTDEATLSSRRKLSIDPVFVAHPRRTWMASARAAAGAAGPLHVAAGRADCGLSLAVAAARSTLM